MKKEEIKNKKVNMELTGDEAWVITLMRQYGNNVKFIIHKDSVGVLSRVNIDNSLLLGNYPQDTHNIEGKSMVQ